MDPQRLTRDLPPVPPNDTQQPQAQISRQLSISSVTTTSTYRRPPSYATYESTDDDRSINERWGVDDGDGDAWSIRRPPSYATAPSLYEDDLAGPSTHSDRLVPLRYAPTSNFLESQFRHTSIPNDDDERPETPTLRNLQISDNHPTQNNLNTGLYELSWDGTDTVETPTALNPPEYTQPSLFNILSQKIEALVTTHHISGHLHLLYAFWQLKNTVENLDDPRQQPVTPWPQEKDRRWTWLVAFAVDRFSTWCKSLSSEDVQYSTQEIIPPVDVLMVWHSYLLNPARYAEDCKRIPCLRVLSHIGQLRLVPALTGELSIILDAPATDIRREVWNSKTDGRAFDIFDDARQSLFKTLNCPDCETIIQHPYMDSHGTGYLQHNFEACCTNISCSFIEKPFDKSSLGARRLVADIVRSDDTVQSLLAGTLWSSQFCMDKGQAQKIKKATTEHGSLKRPKAFDDEQLIMEVLKRYVKTEVLQANDLIQPLNFGKTGWAWEILKKHKFSLLRIVDSINGSQSNEPIRTSQKIYLAYMNGDIFSLDLVGAVLRQSSFSQKMYDMGWSRPGFFAPAVNEAVLQHTVARYHAFLDLVAAMTKYNTLVPTIDIDLAWHTHQLFGVTYHDHCKRYVKFYLDHDDRVDENRLAQAFDETSRAWRARFKLPYTFCGCPQPGKQMFGHQFPVTDYYKKCEDLLKPRSADDIVFQMATHPSDHDAIYDNRRRLNSEAHRKARMEKRSTRETREEGLLKGLANLKGKSAKLESSEPHDPAFFAQIPEWYFQSIERADCVMYAAHTLDPLYFDPRKYQATFLRYSDTNSFAFRQDGSLRRD